MNETKNKRGGARPNSGRPAKGYKQRTLYMGDAEWYDIRRQAAEHGMPIGEYIGRCLAQ